MKRSMLEQCDGPAGGIISGRRENENERIKKKEHDGSLYGA